jgi:hypothetical protein
MHFLYSVYDELTASTCFKQNLLNGSVDKYFYIFIPISAHNIPIVVCVAPPEDEQVVLETRTGCQFIIN